MNIVDCHEEMIHISGHIQDFGYLLGLDAETKTIKFYSQNITSLFPADEIFFGKTLTEAGEIFEPLLSSLVFIGLDCCQMNASDVYMDKIKMTGLNYNLCVYRFNDVVHLELETVTELFKQRNFVSKKYESIHNALDSEVI